MELVLCDAALEDIASIRRIAVATNMFGPDDVGFVDELIAAFVRGEAGGDRWSVATFDREVLGAAYVAPEPFGDRVWNLLFISVDPTGHGRGIGTLLIDDVERALRALGDEVARVLIVETSSTAQYAAARAFYARRGFVEEARIRQFFGPDDDKVVFWKSLVG